MEIKTVAYIKTDFKEKFGIPRQSGLVNELTARIVFEPEFRHPDALRGIEDFSHLWLIFDFSAAHREKWSPTVRPPRLGGNARLGVFATRSPFRPNPIGLSSVKLISVEHTANEGDVLIVAGADLLDNTPIIDIKPYLPYADCHTDATGGFTDNIEKPPLTVIYDDACFSVIPKEKRAALLGCLAEDPRPSYQNDPNRIYSMHFGDFDVHFKVNFDVLEILNIEKL